MMEKNPILTVLADFNDGKFPSLDFNDGKFPSLDFNDGNFPSLKSAKTINIGGGFHHFFDLLMRF